MLRALCIAGVLISLSLIGIQWVLQDSRLLPLADKWPEQAPAVDYHVGEIFYGCQSYARAEVYFQYLLIHFPKSPYAEEAKFARLQCWRYGNLRPPAAVIAECRAFLEQYPRSAEAAEVRHLAENYEKSLFDRTESMPQVYPGASRN